LPDAVIKFGAYNDVMYFDNCALLMVSVISTEGAAVA